MLDTARAALSDCTVGVRPARTTTPEDRALLGLGARLATNLDCAQASAGNTPTATNPNTIETQRRSKRP
ncbi:MAG: hypothetical protein JNK05_23130 [Myxococcales bacterium]|nr:hypothetical protein [Myxococcales bacterium]